MMRKAWVFFGTKSHVDYAHNFLLEIAKILCILQYKKPTFALRASFLSRDDIWSSAEISEALRAFLMFVVVGQVKTWYTAKDVKHAFALRMAD